jgi:hypothetical protein
VPSREQGCMCVKNMEFEEVLVVISVVPCGVVAALLPKFTAILVNMKRTLVFAAPRQDCTMGSMSYKQLLLVNYMQECIMCWSYVFWIYDAKYWVWRLTLFIV